MLSLFLLVHLWPGSDEVVYFVEFSYIYNRSLLVFASLTFAIDNFRGLFHELLILFMVLIHYQNFWCLHLAHRNILIILILFFLANAKGNVIILWFPFYSLKVELIITQPFLHVTIINRFIVILLFFSAQIIYGTHRYRMVTLEPC